MFSLVIAMIKIIFLLGFLILIHEGGHFLVAKLCKVRVNQFSIGFGPEIFHKQGKETKYAIRLIPLGGFVSMEGEVEQSEEQGAFNKASIRKRIAIVAAGAVVNILFGLIVYFVLILIIHGNLETAFVTTTNFSAKILESIKMLVIGRVGVNDLAGPVGISELILQTSGIKEYACMFAMVSISLGITNLLPIPALDGGKIVLLIIEGFRKKPLKEKTEVHLQLLGFSILIILSIFITYNDIIRVFKS